MEKIIMRNQIKKNLNEPKTLVFGFLIFPTLISASLSITKLFFTDKNYWSTFFMSFIDFSSYFYSLSSLILVFVFYRKYSYSDHLKDSYRLKYLESDGEIDFLSAVKCLYESLINSNVIGTESDNKIRESCIVIKNIYNKVVELEDDTYLKSLRYEIKDIVSLINELKIETKKLDQVRFLNAMGKGKKVLNLELKLASIIQDIESKNK